MGTMPKQRSYPVRDAYGDPWKYPATLFFIGAGVLGMVVGAVFLIVAAVEFKPDALQDHKRDESCVEADWCGPNLARKCGNANRYTTFWTKITILPDWPLPALCWCASVCRHGNCGLHL